MNPCLPEWDLEDEVPLATQKKPVGLEQDLVELLWRNGEVVHHSQTNRKSGGDPFGNPASLIQDEDAASWLNYHPVDDSFEKDFCAPFLSEIPPAHPLGTYVENNTPMPPPPATQILQRRPGHGDLRECSVMTVGSSRCGSNHVAIDGGLSRANRVPAEKVVSPQIETGYYEEETAATTTTTSSSSGRSGSSFGRTYCNQSDSHSKKRKFMDGEDSECQHEEQEADDFESGDANKKSGTNRRSRSSMVHNLSERRRRDRINEKMKALQELLPHSNKTDKASMLDEAIEYLKSLQLQLQMMWMGGGMASMMFPGVQHYMSRMPGMGMVPPSLPSMHLQRPPMVDHASMTMAAASTHNQSPMLNPMMNYQNHFQNPNFAEQFASYMGFHPMQSASQFINRLSLGSHPSQPNPMFKPPTNGNGPSA